MNSRIRRPLYIFFKSWLCCCSLPTVAPQQLVCQYVGKCPQLANNCSAKYIDTKKQSYYYLGGKDYTEANSFKEILK